MITPRKCRGGRFHEVFCQKIGQVSRLHVVLELTSRPGPKHRVNDIGSGKHQGGWEEKLIANLGSYVLGHFIPQKKPANI